LPHRRLRGKPLGLSLVGSGPCVHLRRRQDRWRGARVHRELRDARRGQSWHRRAWWPTDGPAATASNLDTLLDRGVGREVRMLLSFQRPSHLFEKVVPSRGAPGNRPDPGADR
jgi:hypothetical protein